MASPASPVVCVLGAGVVGLATAQELLRRGYAVVVLAGTHSLDAGNASGGAGGFWEPFKCEPQELVNLWAAETLEARYLSELKRRDPLIEPTTTLQLHNNKSPPPSWSDCKPYLQYRTVLVKDLPSLGEGTAGTRVNPASGLPVSKLGWGKDLPSGWRHYSHASIWHGVVVDCPQYLARMLAEVKAHANCLSVCVGPEFHFKSLNEATSYAQRELGCAALVNCTGIGAGALCSNDNSNNCHEKGEADEMQSGRGGTVHFPRAKQPSKYPGEVLDRTPWAWNTVVFAEEPPYGSESEPAYVIPRGEVLLVGGSYYLQPTDNLGGTVTPSELVRLRKNRTDLAGVPVPVGGSSSSSVNKAEQSGATADGSGDLAVLRSWVGRRPVRVKGLRVELDHASPAAPAAAGGERGRTNDGSTATVSPVVVVHNYGHGGSGWTIMHGTANAAADLVDGALLRKPLSRL